MNHPLYRAYTWLGSGLFLSGIGPFLLYTRISRRYGSHLKERLGLVPDGLSARLPGRPRIWIHAVSLGEVAAAGSVITALRTRLPGCSVLLSTTTEHGRVQAQESLGDDIPVIYGPIDFVGSVRKALSAVAPQVLVFIETEIWPAWLVEAKRMGIKTALINGRISLRSVKGYLKFRPFFREVLDHLDAFSMISEGDARRIQALGARPDRLTVNGNAKFDALAGACDPAKAVEARKILALHGNEPVLVAGSIRGKEGDMLLTAYRRLVKDFPELILVLAPRHLERVLTLESLLTGQGTAYQLWSELASGGRKRTAPVVVVDTFGELAKIYSVGTIVFCGGSLVPHGGQNPLEAAAWGKVVFYGPSMEDFQDARTLLEAVGAGIEVADANELAQKALTYLKDPQSLTVLGEKAREAVSKNSGAAGRHAEVICQLVQ